MARKSILRSLTQRWLGRARGPSLGVVLGAASCRYVLSNCRDQVFQEPSLVVRRRSDGRIALDETSVGDIARETLVCKNVDRYEYAQIFAGDVSADEYVVSRVLRHFRRRAARRCGCAEPDRLVLTARPGLLRTVRFALASAVKTAGFREAEIVEEYVPLGAAVGIEQKRATLVVHVGQSATRLYVWDDGEYAGSSVSASPGGARMAEALMRWTCGQVLQIAPVTAKRSIESLLQRDAWPIVVHGRDLITGQARTMELQHDSVAAVLAPLFARIGELCQEALQNLAARRASEARVVLTGGAAATGGLVDCLRQMLCADVELMPTPGEARVRGLAQAFMAP